MSFLFALVESREGGDYAVGLGGEVGDAEEEVEDVAGVVVLFAPVVGVVADAALLVHGDLVTVEDPIEGGLAVDDVVVGVEGDVAEVDFAVVVDAGFVEAGSVGFLLLGCQFRSRFDSLGEFFLFAGEGAKITLDLEAVPKGFGLVKEGSKTNRHGGSDGPLSQDDFIDGSGRNANRPRHRVLRNPHWFEVIFEEYLAHANWCLHDYNVPRYKRKRKIVQ